MLGASLIDNEEERMIIGFSSDVNQATHGSKNALSYLFEIYNLSPAAGKD